ncbi:hypothetical protein OCI51_26665 (plasmid) [Lysinibacillus capsici]|uniref:hypothetical protein n=1 Tax=Lysinibacillus capsici TaxID=2115968 RepID=UPI0021DA508A|nr:hypothetical protein [Lysinibacillus capsici]UYB50188.1 hypothetical protein OCI51_27040 [Lysinibacillus capsici]UYB50265.1 hypothetical protein OCI51_26665 [Lysinibacillus capsici]
MPQTNKKGGSLQQPLKQPIQNYFIINALLRGECMDSNEQINSFKDGVYIIQKGKVTMFEPKEHGHDTIIWKNGEALDIERLERIRIKE